MKSIILIWLYLCLFVRLYHAFSIDQTFGHSRVTARINTETEPSLSSQEYDALYDLYTDTNGIYWIWYNTSDNSIPWNFTDSSLNNPCADNWQGVTCSCTTLSCDLDTLVLSLHNLTGTIPSSINAWTSLTILDLGQNYLIGDLPSAVTELTSLQQLILSQNFLGDSLPENIGNLANLEVIDLSANLFNATLPDSFYSMKKLTSINLNSNAFHGNISSSIQNFHSLTSFNLHLNEFTGHLPEELFELPKLTNVDIGENHFHGTLPNTIGKAQALAELNAEFNDFTGMLPSTITNLTTNLTDLWFSHNFFDGPIPDDIGNLQALETLDIELNYFLGALPDSLYNLINLKYFSCDSNFIIGSLSTKLQQLTKLEFLSFGLNYFTGEIPDVFNNMPNLTIFSVRYDFFHGPFPVTLTQATNLTRLDLIGNNLNSSIPREIGRLINLQSIDISINAFTGTLPKEIGNLSSIEFFAMFQNKVFGPVPTELFANTTKVKYFAIGNNLFTGMIPREISQWKDLRYVGVYENGFHGPLNSVRWNQLPALHIFEVNRNFFDGDFSNPFDSNNGYLGLVDATRNLLSNHLPNFNFSTRLQFYEISVNYFSGTIPDYFGTLPKLFHFQISNNILMGPPPNWLGLTAELNYFNASFNYLTGPFNITVPVYQPFTQIQELSIQNNYLTGTIPSNIGEISNIVDLALNNNEFTGTIPESFIHLDDLEALFLQNNKLTGTLPDISNLDLLTNCDLSNNQLTGTLPATFFHEYFVLVSFAASTNCFHGSIPSALCTLNHLQVIELDGLSASSNCRLPIFAGSDVLTSFTLETTIDGGVPDCLFSLPFLETLHLSGNGLTGSLPSNLNISNSLTDLSLSHNLLTGTIPNIIQNRAWENLDLSYNRFTGTLSENFHHYNVNSTLSLQLNRLSGSITGSLINAENINILDGNMFSCNIDKTDLPKHDSTTADYSCGSDVVNATIYSWIILVGCIFFMVFIYRSIYHVDVHVLSLEASKTNQASLPLNRTSGNSSVNTLNQSIRSQNIIEFFIATIQWRFYYLSYEDGLSHYISISKKIPRLLYLRDLFRNIRIATSLILIMVLFILLPFFIGLSYYYKSYHYLYAWSVSGVLKTGVDAGKFLTILSIFFIVMVIAFYELFIIHGVTVVIAPKLTLNPEIERPHLTTTLSPQQDTPLVDHSNVIPQGSFTSWFRDNHNNHNQNHNHRQSVLKIESIYARNTVAHETKEPDSGTWYHIFDILALTLLGLCNLGIMMSADIAYVYVFLHNPTVVIVLAEVILALFKISLNNTLLWISIPVMKRWLRMFWVKQDDVSNDEHYQISRYFYTTRDILFITMSVLLNNIVFPVLAIFVVSSDCFYNGLFPPNEVHSDYTYYVCSEYTPGAPEICLSRRVQYEKASYQPPFIYNYQCASSIIINYAPVFIIMYTFEGVLNILFKLLLKYYYDRLKEQMNNDNQQNPSTTTQEEKRTWNEFFYEKINAILPNYWQDFTTSSARPNSVGERQSYFIDKNRISVRISSYFVVMVSFGALFPPLAIILCVTISSVILFQEIVIGRLLYESDSRGISWIKKQLEHDCYGITDTFQHTLWYLVPVASVLFAYVVFDTWGDESGAIEAILPTLFVGFIPIVIMILFEIYRRNSKNISIPKRRAQNSLGIEFQDAERFSAQFRNSLHSKQNNNENPSITSTTHSMTSTPEFTESQSDRSPDIWSLHEDRSKNSISSSSIDSVSVVSNPIFKNKKPSPMTSIQSNSIQNNTLNNKKIFISNTNNSNSNHNDDSNNNHVNHVNHDNHDSHPPNNNHGNNIA